MRTPNKKIIETICRLKQDADFTEFMAWLQDSWQMAATASQKPPRAEDVPMHFMALGRAVQLDELLTHIELAEHNRLELNIKERTPMRSIFG